jgi:hypothetical protein
VHPVLPCNADDTDPGAHAVQFCAPCTDENDPAGHCVQLVAPTCAEYDPAGHPRHVAAAVSVQGVSTVCPGGHEMQTNVSMLVGTSALPISPGPLPILLVLPVPKRPFNPLPQHLTRPSFPRAHECNSKAETCVANMPGPRSTTGRLLPIWLVEVPTLLVPPYPSLPDPPFPQHFTWDVFKTTHAC